MARGRADKRGSRTAPVAVVMISLNEAHNLNAVLENLEGFAREVFLVDSYSADRTVDIALERGVHVVQRRFRGFGDQWNFALERLPITAPWTMKLDPDERLTDELKAAIRAAISKDGCVGVSMRRRLWFMGRPLPVRQRLVRVWRTGSCRFSDVAVNEYPIVDGPVIEIDGDLEHHDSPNLHHWFDKQNAYSTAEALSAWRNAPLSATPRLFGTSLERRMWLKRRARGLPFFPLMMFLYCLLVKGAWRGGGVGVIWSLMRADVHRWRRYKLHELEILGAPYEIPRPGLGTPHPRVPQYD